MVIGVDGNEANIKRRVGSNQYAFELLWALWRLKNNHQWVVYLQDQPLADLPKERKGWSYRVFGPKKLWTQWRLPLDLFFRRPRPSIFFSPGHYASRWSPMPTVASIMDLGYLKFPEQFTKKDFYQLKHWTERSIKKATHIFAISERTKDDIMKIYSVPEEKITVTYPGYDEEKFKVENSTLRLRSGLTVSEVEPSKLKVEKIKKKYGIQGDYILFLGTLKPSKNVEGLIAAFKHITYHISHITLVVAGKKGWLFEGIFEKVKELGLEKKVIFTDFVSEEEVPSLMLGAEVFVMPSFWEGFGIPVVEAMASGVPVVVSNAGSLPEVVGQAGVVVDPYNPGDIARGIKRALQNKKSLVEKGLKQLRKFSWEECAQKTLKVLEIVVKKENRIRIY